MPVLCDKPFVEDPAFAATYFQQFPFPLSDFQKYAIQAIVETEHVLVCAPTGSGKTLPAEFAIRHFISQGKKVIYTSPIKALSNQKYFEFSQKFPDISVGLCTGDIKTNPSADLIIMTAEILNNRLFQLEDGASAASSSSSFSLSFQMDIQTELAAVIMDEVHYINDADRGHVWEQTIMTLPFHIQMIMLSATLDDPMKFANWIESARVAGEPKKQVYVAQTFTRIVPLTHFAFLGPAPEFLKKHVKTTPLEPIVDSCTRELILLQQPTGKFVDSGYNNMVRVKEAWETSSPTGKLPGRKHTLNSLAQLLKGSDDMDVDDSKLPAIVFLFSRKLVEECAADITANILPFDSKIPYNAARDCEQIIRKLPNWREYTELPEYQFLVKLLEKGIGIHHSGMIPVLREIVELMISQKKIYMLFATESFAIGLDCPIRTTVFTSLSKFDGSCERFLHAHEYTQMAGRAGRRGIDTVGFAIHLPGLFSGGPARFPSPHAYKDILSGQPQTLVSKFHIDYSMVLSLLKEGVQTDFHLFAERSMSTLQIRRQIQTFELDMKYLLQTLEQKKKSLEHIRTPLSTCQEYIQLRLLLPTLNNKKRKDAERKLTQTKDAHKYLDGDVNLVQSIDALEKDLARLEGDILNTTNYMKHQCNLICEVLSERGFIVKDSAGLWNFTPLGEVASHLAEIHPLPFTLLLHETRWFSDWTDVHDIVGVLSAFVDVRVPENMKIRDCSAIASSLKTHMLEALDFLREQYDTLGDQERLFGMHTGLSYGENVLCFDLVEAMQIWCDLADEVSCKEFIQGTHVAGKQISVGDFTKACMKISAMTKEIGSMCEQVATKQENSLALSLACKLREVDGLVLKYVATTQSIYL